MNDIIFWSFWISIGLIALMTITERFYDGPGVDNPNQILAIPLLLSGFICAFTFIIKAIIKVLEN